MSEFEQDKKDELKCPLCGNDLIFVNGGGWDYDRAHCSNRLCKFEKEYETSTDERFKDDSAK